MAKHVRPEPHKIDDRVAIQRYDHGWLDGSVAGTVTAVTEIPTGRVEYVVAGDDGYEYECCNTRDLFNLTRAGRTC